MNQMARHMVQTAIDANRHECLTLDYESGLMSQSTVSEKCPKIR
jgi:hypothetical protein